jgi:hypothetical protein
VCRGDLRIGDALQGCVEGSREGPAAFIVRTARPSGRGDRSAFAGGLSRRRDAVSRQRVTVFFGALERAGSSRSGSSEPGREPEFVDRFHPEA